MKILYSNLNIVNIKYVLKKERLAKGSQKQRERYYRDF